MGLPDEDHSCVRDFRSLFEDETPSFGFAWKEGRWGVYRAGVWGCGGGSSPCAYFCLRFRDGCVAGRCYGLDFLDCCCGGW